MTSRDWVFFGCVFFLTAVAVGVFLVLVLERGEPVSGLRRRQVERLIEQGRIR